MVFNKKAISPVVATALLLVVAVVAVVGFQTWFNTYQSGLNTKVEQQSQTGASLTVERLEKINDTDVYVYIKNTATENILLSAASTKVGTCSLTAATNATASTVTQLTLSTCSTPLTVGSAYDVVLVSTSGVFSANVLAR